MIFNQTRYVTLVSMCACRHGLVQTRYVSLVSMSVNSLLSAVPLHVSDWDLPHFHDAKLSATFCLGLFFHHPDVTEQTSFHMFISCQTFPMSRDSPDLSCTLPTQVSRCYMTAQFYLFHHLPNFPDVTLHLRFIRFTNYQTNLDALSDAIT